MIKVVVLFSIAAICNGATWWAFLLAQASPSPPSYLQLIQLGGTGGLIVALLGAVVVLWRERHEVKAELKKEIDALRQALMDERRQHRDEMAALRGQHKSDLQELTTLYMEELRRQIEVLREETQVRLDDERIRSDDAYREK